MSPFWIMVTILALALVGYILGRRRAGSSAAGDIRKLHSRPTYYGWNTATWTALPSLLLLLVWVLAQPLIVDRAVNGNIPDSAVSDSQTRGQIMSEVQGTAFELGRADNEGIISQSEARALSLDDAATTEKLAAAGIEITPSAPVLEAAKDYRAFNLNASRALTGAALVLALAGLAWSLSQIKPGYRARNIVESFVRGFLILCSLLAIATTVGIVLSLVFESIRFFQLYPWQDFFFGTEWTPSFGGGSKLGMLPLLWGTLYISLIALLFAVPIGLFAAIYMSEYATPRVRGFVKPVIEVLAGIPTIVYGLFALVTVGPLIRDWIAAPAGFGNSASSVMTAGLVMGIMLIPFVSSLSDDIINAVPQSLRDGSLGLGSTPSETVRNVILPAALPGIVGAILLAASRAIGETMIVVLGAGAMARISGNPFDAMTTITVKIVGQLTGDNDFASPETLVAFALGLTLFVMTLALNIVALVIVRKYREQYE